MSDVVSNSEGGGRSRLTKPFLDTQPPDPDYEGLRTILILGLRTRVPHDEVEDRVHDAFIRLWEAKDDIRNKAAWLWASAGYAIRTEQVKARRRARLLGIRVPLESHVACREAEDRMAEQLDLAEAIRRLPPPERFVIEAQLADCSLREIARMLGVPYHVVVRVRAAALQTLRARLAG